MGGQNHYQVLGVSADAGAAQIRAAYVSLLKRHHPDQASAREAPENVTQIERIIRAYRVLKDPASRDRYDATLRPARRPNFQPNAGPYDATSRPAARPGFPPNGGPSFTQTIRRAGSHFKLDPEAISYAVILVIAAVGLHLLVSRIIQQPRPTGKVQPGAPAIRELAARTQLEAAVRNAGMMSRAEARDYSSRCFAATRLGRDAVATDTCIGFDMAYVYWRDTIGGPLVDDPYFQQAAMETRFRSALGRLNPSKVAVRVQSVRAATLRAITQTPRPTDEFGFAPSEQLSVSHTVRSQKGNPGTPSRE